jgi:hypothetical protein
MFYLFASIDIMYIYYYLIFELFELHNMDVHIIGSPTFEATYCNIFVAAGHRLVVDEHG